MFAQVVSEFELESPFHVPIATAGQYNDKGATMMKV